MSYFFMKKICQSIASVALWFLTVAVFSTLTDMVLESLGIFPKIDLSKSTSMTTWMLLLALSYRILYTFTGWYVTASLAPNRPMKHVFVLAALWQLWGIAWVIVGWHLSAHWYPLAIALTAIPCIWIWGYLKTEKRF